MELKLIAHSPRYTVLVVEADTRGHGLQSMCCFRLLRVVYLCFLVSSFRAV
jgi:hypothetical protein